MNRKSASPIGVGVLTVLTILLVLTLAVFSALTYASARADLALSRKNAETVTAYYAADAEARKLLEDFRGGEGGDELVSTIPMTEMQALSIHLERDLDGTVHILAWKTVPAGGEGDAVFEEPPLPVFDGTLPS